MNSRWGHAIIDELSASGVGHFFICPGSRSTPLALAVAERGYPSTVHYDERGAAFAALGYGAATGKPAAWITTSGTAVANGLPAVVEASISNIPMALVTADRPPELRNTGANQTIDQVEIFGSYVRGFVDVPPPGGDFDEAILRTTVHEKMVVKSPGPGPVHFNCMFREPLVSPSDAVAPTGSQVNVDRPLQVKDGVSPMDSSALDAIVGQVRSSEKVLLVVGGGLSDDDEEAIAGLSGILRCPIFADIRTGLRRGTVMAAGVVHNFDLLLQSKHGFEKPEVVIHFGERMTSKFVYAFLNDEAIQQSRIDLWGKVVDPDRRLDHVVRLDVGEACRSMVEILTRDRRRKGASGSGEYNEGWQKSSAAVRGLLPKIRAARYELTEPSLAYNVSRLMPADGNLILAASMPVRDMDSYATHEAARMRVFSNRGASGIDGTIATASGIAIANGHPTVVVTGDLALLHDLNSLPLVPKDVPFTIVAINNDGGGIFSFLPVAGLTPYFERMFGTPHGLNFEAAADMFGFQYEAPATLRDFERVFLSSSVSGRTLIEVRTDRSENVALHREIVSLVADAMSTA